MSVRTIVDTFPANERGKDLMRFFAHPGSNTKIQGVEEKNTDLKYSYRREE